MSEHNETYLGDAVYASFDGYQIWLRTGDGNNQQIALEPEVIHALFQYVAAIKRQYAPDLSAAEGDGE